MLHLALFTEAPAMKRKAKYSWKAFLQIATLSRSYYQLRHARVLPPTFEMRAVNNASEAEERWPLPSIASCLVSGILLTCTHRFL